MLFSFIISDFFPLYNPITLLCDNQTSKPRNLRGGKGLTTIHVSHINPSALAETCFLSEVQTKCNTFDWENMCVIHTT